MAGLGEGYPSRALHDRLQPVASGSSPSVAQVQEVAETSLSISGCIDLARWLLCALSPSDLPTRIDAKDRKAVPAIGAGQAVCTATGKGAYQGAGQDSPSQQPHPYSLPATPFSRL